MTEHRWQGSTLLRPGVLAFIGSIGATDRHAHHAVQIITATTALTVVDGTDVRHCGTTVIVPADAAHRIETGAAAGSVVFLDPESVAGPCPIDTDQLGRLSGARTPSTPLPPPPLPPGSLRAQRKVHASGRIMVAGQNIKLGPRHRGKIVTVVIEDTHLRVMHGEEEIAVRP